MESLRKFGRTMRGGWAHSGRGEPPPLSSYPTQAYRNSLLPAALRTRTHAYRYGSLLEIVLRVPMEPLKVPPQRTGDVNRKRCRMPHALTAG